MSKPRVAVHKFSSCDGCQLAFLNAGEALLELFELLDIKHFVEAGKVDVDAEVDIAFVEGSISTPDELERILSVRKNSNILITIGACATAGGIQALRNDADVDAWMADVYASPEYIETLATATAISQHVKVDFEIWGCPVTTESVMQVIRQFLLGVMPIISDENVCLTCKQQGNPCVLVNGNQPCMGPVTRTGCGALCPSMGRACYACFGPAENINTHSLTQQFKKIGLSKDEIARRFKFITAGAPAFEKATHQVLMDENGGKS